jgi:hypothetical protein|eukprot:COSAG01_NODE_2246_length_8080_cov_4.007017_11_plen_54_part_00
MECAPHHIAFARGFSMGTLLSPMLAMDEAGISAYVRFTQRCVVVFKPVVTGPF